MQESHDNPDLGRYYHIDIRRNMLVDTPIDLEALARRMSVLKEWEMLADE